MANKSRKGVKNKEKSNTGISEHSKSKSRKTPSHRDDGGGGVLVCEETQRQTSPQPNRSNSSLDVAPCPKKEVERVKSTIQPTSEQMMIAQLIQHEDPKHKLKIQNVMDITNKEEDEVATALFDSAWDESKAIELLLDVNGGRDGFGEWEETGKRKKRNKQAHEEKQTPPTASSTDDWDESAGDHSNNQPSDSNREKSRQRGPPRMRRGGGSNAGGRGGGRGGGMSDRSSYNNNYNDSSYGATDGEGVSNSNNYHQSGQRSRGQPPRRGGGSRGGDRGGRNNNNYQPRYDRSNQSNSSGHPGNQGGSSQAFSGSIDTWNPSGENSEQSNKKSRNNNKDAFDNAGNWGDDFPAAEDWDNEEYTGSLADTKVFTAKNTGGPKMPSAVGQNRGGPSAAQASQHSPQQSQSQTSQGSSSDAASSSQQPQPQQPSTYSQSIDLSTLLQKPTTQSSLTNPQNLLQFQQHASDSLKSVVGLSSTSSRSVSISSSSQAQGSTPGSTSSKGDLYYGSSNQQSGGSYGALIKSGTGGNKSPHVISNKSRLPPPSKIPSSAVEMPGDSLTKLDVQFGGLDLQFGAPASAGDPSVSGTNGGFDFGGSSTTSGSSSATGESSKYLGGGSDKSKLDVYSSSAPSAKEVTKSLASKIDSSIGFDRSSKSSSSTSNNATAAYKTQEVMNNFNPSSNPPYSSYPNQPSQPGSVQQQTSGKNYPPGASSNFNQYSQYSNQSNGSYVNNGPQQQQQPYSQASSGSYNNVNGSASSSSVTASNYPSSSNVTTANYNNNYNSVSSNSASSSNSAQQSYGNSKGSTYESATSSLKYDTPPSVSTSAMQNSIGVPGGSTATALGLTSTTNALSGKISATSASKVNLSNFPPGVASMLPTQYMIGNAQAGIPPFYGLQQHMYSTYNASTASGIEELAALQRGAAAAGLHTLPTTGYYDPNSQFATSLAAATSGGSRTDGNASGSAGSNSINSLNDKNFGGNNNSVGGNESTSSPIPSTLASAVAAATTPAAARAAAQAAAAAQQQQQQSFSLNTFAPQHQTAIPAPYAYYFGPGLQAYGSGVYPAAPMNVVPTAAGGTASTQFQKTGYGSSYASAYENLGQVNKEFNPTYSSGTGNNRVAAGGVAAGSSSTAPGKGNHQYWNNATNHLSSQLWG